MARLDPNQLIHRCDIKHLDFESTEEIADATTVIGQERVESSMEFGVNIARGGYNIFALGPNGTNKLSHIKQFLEKKGKEKDTPADICYVNNFDDRYKPQILSLPAGRGIKLKNQMDKVMEDLVPTLRSSFETEEYQNRKQTLQNQIQQEQDQTFEDLQKKARQKNLALIRTPAGFSFAPARNGELMDESDIRELSDKEKNDLKRRQKSCRKNCRN